MNQKHSEFETKGTFYFEMDNRKIAEVTYSKAGADKIIIDHTEVEEEFRGEDLGKKLVYTAAEFARKSDLKILPVCPFARSVFLKNKEIQDVL